MKMLSKNSFGIVIAITIVMGFSTLKARDVSVGILKDWNAAWSKCPVACQKRGGWRGFWSCNSTYTLGNRRNEFIFTPYACTCECVS